MRAAAKEYRFSLSPSFDMTTLVARLKQRGWWLGRRTVSNVKSEILDAPSRMLLSAGLVAVAQRARGPRTISLWFVPRKGSPAERLLAGGIEGPKQLRTMIGRRFGLSLEGPLKRAGGFTKSIVSMNAAASGGAKAALALETVPVAGSRAVRTLVISVPREDARACAWLVRAIRGCRGVKRRPAPGISAVLAARGVAIGPQTVHAAAGGKDGAPASALEILRRSYLNVLLQEPGTRVGLDPEYVHDMRVHLRRMRAALRVFRKVFAKEGRARLNAELRRLANLLGDVRDRDVYIGDIPRYLEYVGGRVSDYGFFLRELRAKRRAARAKLVAALDGPPYRAFRKRVEEFLSDPPLSGEAIPLEDIARRGLASFSEEVFSKGRKVRTEEDLHALRLSFKRLRYAVECLWVLAPKRMGRIARAAARYQDTLGEFNDATLACARVKEAALARGRDPLEVLLLGYLLGCQRLAAIEAKNDFLRRWRLKGAKRLSQAIASALNKLS